MAVISYLLNFLAIMFAGFRAYIVLQHTKDVDYFIKPLNVNIEIVILFASILLIYLIFRRKLAAGVIYFGIYFAYFGTVISKGISAGLSEDVFISFLGIIIALLNFLDLLFNNSRVGKKGDSKTDWFYDNEKYEKDDDPRRDKNRYRIM